MRPTDWSVVTEDEPSPSPRYPRLTTLLLAALAAVAGILVAMLVTGWRP